MIAECLIFSIGVIIQISSTHVRQQITMGCFVSGIGVDALSAAVPMYQAEAAPSQIRGTLTVSGRMWVVSNATLVAEGMVYSRYTLQSLQRF